MKKKEVDLRIVCYSCCTCMFVSRDLNQISGEFAMSAFNFGWNNATVTESIR